MVPEVKSSIKNLYKTSYAKEAIHTVNTAGFMDCSNGINPFGISKMAESSLNKINIKDLNSYPKPADGLKHAICDYWHTVAEIDKTQIILGNGSIELIYKINKLFLDCSSKVLGYSPQFSDFVDDVKSNGGFYESYYLDKANNFKFNPEKYISRMNTGHSMFFIDNPNNPTGQVINADSIEKIIYHANQLNRPIIIDEAYGDFMSRENSAVSLINKYKNLIVIRTLSKGLGLAGLRAGYLVTSEEIADQYHKISNPYEMNSIARLVAEAALKDDKFMSDCCSLVSLYKKKLIDSLQNLVVLETDVSVPIMTLMHPQNNVDFEELLLRHKVISVSGRGFEGLGNNFVRLMVNADIERMIEVFRKVEKDI